MFFKAIETCQSDSSNRYSKDEVNVFIFEAFDLNTMNDYYKDLHDYNDAHCLTIRLEILDDDEVANEMKAARQSVIMDIGDF